MFVFGPEKGVCAFVPHVKEQLVKLENPTSVLEKGMPGRMDTVGAILSLRLSVCKESVRHCFCEELHCLK